jgi:hypothetical protein
MFKELFEESPKLDKKAKEILKWLDDFLGDITEAIKKGNLSQGSFKEILADVLTNFKSIDKFFILQGKLAIDGILNDGSKVIKQIRIPQSDSKKRDEIVKILNVKVLPKFKKDQNV